MKAALETRFKDGRGIILDEPNLRLLVEGRRDFSKIHSAAKAAVPRSSAQTHEVDFNVASDRAGSLANRAIIRLVEKAKAARKVRK